MSRALALFASLLVSASPALAQTPFTSLSELDAALAAVDHGEPPDALWAKVRAAGAMPLLFGETAVFLHRSKAAKVEWRGDFNGWDSTPDAQGKRLGQSDLWTWRRTFVPAARVDYKLVEDGSRWLVDPLNPNQQLGGFGPNSEVRMPGYVPPASIRRGPEVPRGKLLPNQLLRSKKLGYEVNVRVYEPSRKEGDTGRLPVLVVTDGSDYYDSGMGSLVATLDNLIAQGRIPPLVAAFVDPWSPDHRVNRREQEYLPAGRGKTVERCPYCDFLADELVPLLDQRYPTDPARRAVIGASFGAIAAALTGLRRTETFSLLGLQSPSAWAQPALPGEIAQAPSHSRRVAIVAGLYEQGTAEGARGLAAAYLKSGAQVLHREVPEGHSWGSWRATIADVLEFLFANR